MVALSFDTPGGDEERHVLRCPSCGWEIEFIGEPGVEFREWHRPTLRCLRTEAHADGLLAEMEVVES